MVETPPEALKIALAVHLGDVKEKPDSLELGEFRLAGSPSFGRDVADTFALASNLPGFEDFRRMFSARDLPKPARPSPEFIEAEARAIERDPARLPYAKALIAERLGQIYSDKLSEYEAKRKERDTLEQNHENSDLGYIRFLCSKDPKARSFFFDRYWTLPISEDDRKRHTYISGAAGSGKSEALKTIILHYLTRNTSTGVVLIDPHGEVAEQVAKWPELSDEKRLVYIDPALTAEKTPVFNPLDIPEAERNPDDIAIIVKQLIEVFPELIEGLEFTPQMKTMVSACLTVLLHAPSSSLTDLREFMDDTKNGPWLQLADEVLSGSMYRDYFRRDFMDKSSDITKRGVRMRLLEAFQGNPPFLRMIAGKSTFNLEELLQRRAVVIFRFGRGEIVEETSNLLGKFIIARLKAFAFKQGRLSPAERVPVHVFIDECQNYLSESVAVILKEARKYGVHLTLAQQILGDGMSPDLLKSVLGNTAVKITGKNALHTLKKIADETGADLDELQALSTGYFHVKAGARKGVVVRMPGNRLMENGAVSSEVWERIKNNQVSRFYRTPSPDRSSIAPTQKQLPID